MQDRDRDDGRDVEPDRDVQVPLSPARDRDEEVHGERDPDHRDREVDGAVELLTGRFDGLVALDDLRVTLEVALVEKGVEAVELGELGAQCGDGAVIGAGAVVRSDVPAGAIAVGMPAKVVGQRGEVASS